MTIRVIIVDDEPLARRAIQRHLAHESDVEIVAECGDGKAAVELIRCHKPDLLFLDVQLPPGDGFDVLRALDPQDVPLTIFVTAHDRYAVHAFESAAVDYILKPFLGERFRQSLARARSRLASRESVRYPNRLPVHERGHVTLVRIADIDWIEAAGNYVRLHAGPRAHLIRRSIGELQRTLPPEQFVRIHRSTIVNVERVKEIHPWQRGHHLVVLEGGQRLRLSRYLPEVLRGFLGA